MTNFNSIIFCILFTLFTINAISQDKKESIIDFMKDQDGNSYKTVRIGNHIWMAENLKTTKFRNGEKITQVNINNSERISAYESSYSKSKNGDYFYTWSVIRDSRGIAPSGWHIPTLSEWNELISLSERKGENLKSKTGWTPEKSGGYRETIVCPNCRNWNSEYRRKVPCHVCKDTRWVYGNNVPVKTTNANGYDKLQFNIKSTGYVHLWSYDSYVRNRIVYDDVQYWVFDEARPQDPIVYLSGGTKVDHVYVFSTNDNPFHLQYVDRKDLMLPIRLVKDDIIEKPNTEAVKKENIYYDVQKNETHNITIPKNIHRCEVENVVWEVGCQNYKIGLINNKLLGKSLDGVLTEETIKILVDSAYISRSSTTVPSYVYDQVLKLH